VQVHGLNWGSANLKTVTKLFDYDRRIPRELQKQFGKIGNRPQSTTSIPALTVIHSLTIFHTHYVGIFSSIFI
jgi:hypothetical protein